MKKKNYDHYFQDIYKVSYKKTDIDLYRKWIYAQWKIINGEVDIKKDKNILEIGSGIGVLYSFLEESNLIDNYEGLELDNSATRFTNKHFRTTNFKNISFEEYNTNIGKDYIFAFEVLEHLENPIKSVNKIHATLNKRGIFIGTSPYPFKKNVLACPTHKYVLHPENWRKIFVEAGFCKVKLKPMSFLPSVWRINRNLNIRLPLYLALPAMISTCLIIAVK